MPTIAFTTSDLAGLTARAEELTAERDLSGVTTSPLCARHGGRAGGARPRARRRDRRRRRPRAYVLLDGDIHTSKLLGAKEFNALGRGTARTVKVLRTVTEKWC